MSPKLKLTKSNLRLLWRAIIEFDMLAPGDRVLVGLSGGKDSTFLLYALKVLQQHAPFAFDLAALTIDIGVDPEFDSAGLEAFCRQLGVPFYLERTKIYDLAFAEGGRNACATCAFFRRGTMNRLAAQHGFNKVAYAHHLDDAVETFYMSIIYSGQIQTFKPVTHLDQSGITVIRPLLYFREQQVIAAQKQIGFAPVVNPCPKNGTSMRAEAKQTIRELGKTNPRVFDNLLAAMREGAPLQRWPAPLDAKTLWQKSVAFWGKVGFEK